METLKRIWRIIRKPVYFFGDVPQEHSIGHNGGLLGLNQSLRDWGHQVAYTDAKGDREWYDRAFVWPLYLLVWIVAALFRIFMHRSVFAVFAGSFRAPRKIRTLGLIIVRAFLRFLTFIAFLAFALAVVVLACIIGAKVFLN